MSTFLDVLAQRFPLPWQAQRDETCIDEYGDDAVEWDILDANGNYTGLTCLEEDAALLVLDFINLLGSPAEEANLKLKLAQMDYLVGQLEA
jgi:hypothetical protein